MANVVEVVLSGTDAASGAFSAVRLQAQEFGSAVKRAGEEAVQSAEEMQHFGHRVEGLLTTFSQVGLSIFAVQQGFQELSAALGVEQIEKYGHAVLALQTETGATAETASTLLSTFERYGIEADRAGAMLSIFAKHLHGIADESDLLDPKAKGFTQVMGELGVSIHDAGGNARDMTGVLFDMADRFQSMPDGIDKTAAAVAAFGRSGRDMILLLNQGSAGLKEAMDAAQKYGLQLSDENVEQIHRFAMAQKDLEEASTGLKLQLAEQLVPTLITVDHALAAAIAHSGEWGAALAQVTFATPLIDTAKALLDLNDQLERLNLFRDPIPEMSGALGQLATDTEAAAVAWSQLNQELTAFTQSGTTEGSGAVGRASALAAALDQQAAERAALIAQGQALAGTADSDAFQRHAGPGANLAKALAPSDADIAAEAVQLQKAWDTYHREAARITAENERIADQEEKRAAAEAKRLAEEQHRDAEQAFARQIGGEQLQLSNLTLWQQIKDMQAAAPDRATMEREIHQVERDRVATRIALQQAEHDGNQEAIAALKERIALLDAEIARVTALGVAEQPKQAATRSYFGGAPPGAVRVPGVDWDPNDPYGINHGGQHWVRGQGWTPDAGTAAATPPNLPPLPPKPEVALPEGTDAGPTAGGLHVHGDLYVTVDGGDPDRLVKRLRDAAATAAQNMGGMVAG